MASIISIGDVLMLSQVAWKIGCAFTTARAGAPEEFLEVESELVCLTTALDQLAETLDDDVEILANTNETAQVGICRVLIRCRQTLQDLNSFVTRYQDPIRSESGPPNGEVERSWMKVLIKNWRTVWWTPEGGDIDDLREALHMHASTISMIIQALQSKSLSQLERIMTMLAVPVEDVHDVAFGRMNTTINDMRQVMVSRASQRLAEASGPSSPHSRLNGRGTRRASSTRTESAVLGRTSEHSNSIHSHISSRTPHHNTHFVLSPQITPELVESDGAPAVNEPSISTMSPLGSPYRLPDRFSPMVLSMRTSRQGSGGWDVSGDHPESYFVSPETGIGQATRGREDQARYRQDWPLMASAGPSHSRRPSEKPILNPLTTNQDPSSFTRPTKNQSETTLTPAPLSVLPRSPGAVSDHLGFQRPPQPTPDLYSYLVPTAQSPVQNSLSLFPQPPSAQPLRENVEPNFPSPPPRDPARLDQATVPLDPETFEKALRQDSVILCEVKGTLVEYTRWDVDGRDYKVAKATADCRIFLVQQQEHQSDAGIRYSTSIWALSDDRHVRFQQKLLSGQIIIPYTVWGGTNKVAIRVASFLEFHSATYGAPALKTTDSNWVNYVFENEAGSKMFQAALMGKTLLLSVSTNKTTRVQEGLSGAFASQERICGLENLRIWQDHENNGVLAMIHFTPQFRKGYLAFYLNSKRDPIRIREESERVIKIKDLNIPLDPKVGSNDSDITMGPVSRFTTTTTTKGNFTSRTGPGAFLGRRPSKKYHHHNARSENKRIITTAKIEFTTEDDKNAFLMMHRQVQELFFPG